MERIKISKAGRNDFLKRYPVLFISKLIYASSVRRCFCLPLLPCRHRRITERAMKHRLVNIALYAGKYLFITSRRFFWAARVAARSWITALKFTHGYAGSSFGERQQFQVSPIKS